jgi:hypothetical protein
METKSSAAKLGPGPKGSSFLDLVSCWEKGRWGDICKMVDACMMHALASCTVSPFVLQRGATKGRKMSEVNAGLRLGSSRFFQEVDRGQCVSGRSAGNLSFFLDASFRFPSYFGNVELAFFALICFVVGKGIM